jgi:hypothetical protein
MKKIEYPEWLPDSVKKKCIPIIENNGMPSKHIEILTRLLTDPRMDKVYATLMRVKGRVNSYQRGGVKVYHSG